MKPNQVLRNISLLILASLTLTAQVARQETVVPLKNWATPLYWQPGQTERGVSATGAQLTFSSNQVSSNALTFIAITPCRLIDTRGVAANFNGIAPFSGPSIPATTAVTFPVQSATEASTDTTPAPCGTIPAIAQAYSLNLTVVPVAAGAVDYISMWPSGYPQPFVATLNDPQGAIVANAAIVPAGTVNGGISVYNQGPANANVIIDMNGFFAAPEDLNGNLAIGAGALASNTTGEFNTASGGNALTNNTTGGENTASGAGAMYFNTTGSNNTASGFAALGRNTTATNNSAFGSGALGFTTTGNDNTGMGEGALTANTTGSNNTATGQAALTANTTGGNNTAAGQAALQNNGAGSGNTAIGQNALQSNTTTNNNTAVGLNALQLSNTSGSSNTAVGAGAMANTTTGGNNTATGGNALGGNTTGSGNTAGGEFALAFNTTGSQNVAYGDSALFSNTTGGDNIAIGFNAGRNPPVGNSNSIYIGNGGAAGDASGTISIGAQGTQTSTSIAGIYGGSPATPNLPVCVDATGLLGTTGCTSTPSSRRFKEQISDMGDSSNKLSELRPVTFRYKPEYDDGSHALQFGLIAEEVANIYPDMVGYDKDGQPSSVKYQALTPMLLNEVQKQNAQLRQQAGQNLQQAERIRSLEDRLAALEALLSSEASAAVRTAGLQ